MGLLLKSIALGLSVAVASGYMSASATVMDARPGGGILDAKQLYEGYQARKVLLSEDGNALELDGRVFRFGNEREGVITTDPVDLGPSSGPVGVDSEVKAVAVEVRAEVPEGGAVETQLRSGPNKLDQSEWSEWSTVPDGKGTVEGLAGRYVQVRITLKGADADNLPAVTALVLEPDVGPLPRDAMPELEVVESDIQHIIRSPIEFHYERPDQPEVVAFREAAGLDEVVEGAESDFDKLVKLMDWVGSCHNDREKRPHMVDGRYTWDINKVFEIVDGTPTIYGHCMSYAQVLVYAAISMGYVGARHYAVAGFRSAYHEVADIWVPSLGRWVYFDPSLTSYYMDKETGEPLSSLDIHDVIVETFIPEGRDMSWFVRRRSSETRRVVREIGGKTPIRCRLGPWRYGEPMDEDYDWGFYHGYLANGFVQMTPRNDFQSNPDAIPDRFGNLNQGPDYPFWADEKTPLRRGVTNWFTRRRDFEWTLDQASLNLVRTGPNAVRVELGHSMPFFDHYKLTVNGEQATIAESAYDWTLRPGENTLTVKPVDEFNKVGQGSTVTLKLGD